MLGVYIVGLAVGGVLVLLSVLGAAHGHDADVGHGADLSHDTDLSHDAGHDGEVSHDMHSGGGMSGQETWIPFLSIRFWTYFFAISGLIGVLLTYVFKMQEPSVALFSFPTGVLGGLVVAYTMRAVRGSEANSATREQDLLGASGKVTVAIHSGQPGRIRCTVKGDILDLLALPESGEDIPLNSEVVIVGMENQFAKVMPMSNILES